MKKQFILLSILTVSILIMCSCGSKVSVSEPSNSDVPSDYTDNAEPLNSDSGDSDIDEDNVSDDSVTFGAVIYQVMDDTILVRSVDKPDDVNSGQMYYVSLKDIDSKELQVNQCAEITFDGLVLETYPAQITASRINIVGVTDNIDGIINKEIFNSDVKPAQIVRLDDALYYNTYTESDITGRCGMMDGYIDKTISKSEIPVENNQSNFGTDYSYQWVDDSNVDIYIDGKFIRFQSIA